MLRRTPCAFGKVKAPLPVVSPSGENPAVGEVPLEVIDQAALRYRTNVRIPDGGGVLLAGATSMFEQIDPDDAARLEANKGIECINCSVCYAACDTVANNPDYLGPAALQRAWTLINDIRDGDHDGILDAVSGSGGCHNCHSMGSCTAYCPVGLDPMSAIAGLKRATVRRAWRR